MFCVSCGKKAIHDNLCEDCFTDRNPLFSTENFRFQLCDCGSFYRKSWQKARPFNEVIEIGIGDHLTELGKITSVDVKKKIVGNVVIATTTCEGIVPPAEKTKKETRNIEIRIKKMKCDYCVKLSGGYHEAVLQLRGKEPEKLLEKIQTGVVEKLKVGYDVKFIRKSDAARVARMFKRGYTITRSYKFVTEKKGKKLYRDYYAIRKSV